MQKRFSPKLSRTSVGMSGRAPKMNRLLGGLLMTVVALAPLRPAAAQTAGYTVTDLGLIPGATSSSALSVSDNGAVVGSSSVPLTNRTSTTKGWLWTPDALNPTTGSLRTLAPLTGTGLTRSLLDDVRNDGMVVGVSLGDSGYSGLATYWLPSTGYAPVDFNTLPRDLTNVPSPDKLTFVSARLVSEPRPAFVLDPATGQPVLDPTTNEPVPDPRAGEYCVAGQGSYLNPDGTRVNRVIVWRINAAGTIVGVVELIRSFGTTGLNNRAQLAGYWNTPYGYDRPFQAFLNDGLTGSYQFLGTLGGRQSYAYGINDNGTVVGQAVNLAGAYLGFIWTPYTPNGTDGAMVALGTLGGTRSCANGINDQNQTVGNANLKGNRTQHACLWWNGGMWDLNNLKSSGATGLELLDAKEINSKGAIIGRFNSSQVGRAFLLTPR